MDGHAGGDQRAHRLPPHRIPETGRIGHPAATQRRAASCGIVRLAIADTAASVGGGIPCVVTAEAEAEVDARGRSRMLTWGMAERLVVRGRLGIGDRRRPVRGRCLSRFSDRWTVGRIASAVLENQCSPQSLLRSIGFVFCGFEEVVADLRQRRVKAAGEVLTVPHMAIMSAGFCH